MWTAVHNEGFLEHADLKLGFGQKRGCDQTEGRKKGIPRGENRMLKAQR